MYRTAMYRVSNKTSMICLFIQHDIAILLCVLVNCHTSRTLQSLVLYQTNGGRPVHHDCNIIVGESNKKQNVVPINRFNNMKVALHM